MNTQGRHITADIWCIELPGNDQLIASGTKAIRASGMCVVEAVSHRFDPQGITGVWILAESHMTMHTYPEENYLSVDVYTCGEEGDPLQAITALLSMIAPVRVELRFMSRGARAKE